MTYEPPKYKRRAAFARGICSQCRQEYPLRDDGTVRKHQEQRRQTASTCPGSAFLPERKL